MKNPNADTRALLLLVATGLLAFGYFFQGDGWAHHANYSTIRALVERRSFEITSLRDKTGDVAIRDGRVYSNKPPGLPLIAAIPYAVIRSVEQLVGLDSASARVDQINQWLMTIVLCALPATLTVAMLFVALRRDGASTRAAALLALAFATGSLFLPYSGMLYNHVLVAACIFGAFLLITNNQSTAFASLLLGVACISEYIAIPLVVLFLAHEFWIHRNPSRVAVLAIGPAIALIGLMWFHHNIFGNAFATSYAFEDERFREQAAGAARFHLPELQRLLWITWGRMRGLFYCCPLFVLPIVSLLYVRSRPASRQVFALLVVTYFVMVLLCYRFWAGGFGIGPRFAIPALPFLFLFARRASAKLPWLACILAVISAFNMIAVTSVRAEFPGNDSGPPQHWDPVGVCTLALLRGQIAQPEHSSNLGLAIGLSGVMSLLPLVLILISAIVVAFYLPDNAARASTETASAQRAYMAPDGCKPSATTSCGEARESGVTST